MPLALFLSSDEMLTLKWWRALFEVEKAISDLDSIDGSLIIKQKDFNFQFFKLKVVSNIGKDGLFKKSQLLPMKGLFHLRLIFANYAFFL